jgi:hypothetical protein
MPIKNKVTLAHIYIYIYIYIFFFFFFFFYCPKLYRTLYASIMEIKPTDLKAKFNQVFEKHRELEESEEFQSKKRKHQDLK